MAIGSFLINIEQNKTGEWVANFSDGSVVLHAYNYHDAVLEADLLMAENAEDWNTMEAEYDDFMFTQQHGDFYHE
ncbi:hypothetical protein UFOVP257_234 [uncultured Caudovirales phage]|uniref:Uncharacterized protein n=1 Tax=uncultured Caudovirales phage TaxID=2100421 RepID=A0A6J5LIY1_9CAUD|nr:hypothetical protein UFOVP257_234 [uncultured Caudovirales phage]